MVKQGALQHGPTGGCESACKKDPVYGVIGVQKGSLSPGG